MNIYCIGVDNGLNAISLGIKALEIGEGDEVIVAANTYIATVLGVSHNKATPVFVDADDYVLTDHLMQLYNPDYDFNLIQLVKKDAEKFSTSILFL